MDSRPYAGFYARFLGGFSLSYEGREIRFNRNLQNRAMQIFLMLLKAGAEGVERKKILATIRPDETDLKKRQNNFRQQIHILRQMIGNTGFPEGVYVAPERGRYYFAQGYEIRTDTQYLDDLIKKIRNVRSAKKDGWEEEVQGLYKAYCQAYTGEFLPMLGGEEWVAAESAFYQRWYFTCVNSCCQALKEQGEYEAMLELSTIASRLHPYDEWQAVQIECLIAMDRYQEALKVYEEATEIFYKDLGVTSLDRVMARYRGPGRERTYAANALVRLKRDLEEKGRGEDGPYHCSYPSFQDAYRFMARLAGRTGTKNLLLLCTLMGDMEQADGPADIPDTLEQEMLRFKNALVKVVRAEDIYTRYSRNQYLVLLTGAGEKEGRSVIRRLVEAWGQRGDQRAEVRFAFQEIEDTVLEEAECAATS